MEIWVTMGDYFNKLYPHQQAITPNFIPNLLTITFSYYISLSVFVYSQQYVKSYQIHFLIIPFLYFYQFYSYYSLSCLFSCTKINFNITYFVKFIFYICFNFFNFSILFCYFNLFFNIKFSIVKNWDFDCYIFDNIYFILVLFSFIKFLIIL